MNLVEKLPLSDSLTETSIKGKLKTIEQSLRSRRMPMLYELIAKCKQDTFVNAVKNYNICPSFFCLKCNCVRSEYPATKKQEACESCWNVAINKSNWYFGSDIVKPEDIYFKRERRKKNVSRKSFKNATIKSYRSFRSRSISICRKQRC